MKRQNLFICVFSTLLVVAVFCGCINAQGKVPAVQISEDGKALQKILISSGATDATKESAQTLADYLHKISGGDFVIDGSAKVLSPSSAGITLGTISDFSDVPKQFDPNDPTKTEDYWLRTHINGISIVGATNLGLSNAIWDFLYRLGYRQFFPTENWEIVPNNKNINIAVNTFQHPSYYSRRIWAGGGVQRENTSKWKSWNERNRMVPGIKLNTGHSYGSIVNRNKSEFEMHPEYLTKIGSSKFCVSNEGLQQLVVNDALKRFDKDSLLQSVSMDPSDGGGWESDSCPDAEVFNSITDRVVTLANLVAEGVNDKHPGKFVGIYAYNQHSPAPTIKLHPNVVPSIATSFIRGGFTLDQLLDEWGSKAKQLGIREYYSVFSWNRDLPGRSYGSNLKYLAQTIPHFYEKGARFLTAESGDNWAPHGLGYYIASRILWDVNEARNIDALRTDFLEKSFGSARQPMDKFYDLIDGSNKPLFSEDLIGRLYRQLDEALRLTDDSAIRARIMDLALYVRYLELYDRMKRVSKDEHLEAFIDVLRYAWRIREAQMIHSRGVWRGLARYEKIKIPEGHTFRDPIESNPWKSDEPVTDEEIMQFISEGVKNNELRSFEIKSYDSELMKAEVLDLKVPSGRKERIKIGTLRGISNLITWIDGTMVIRVRAGTIYTNRGNVKLSLHEYGQIIADDEYEDEDAPIAPEALQTFEVPPDKEWHEYTFRTAKPGTYVLRVENASMGAEAQWAGTNPVTFESTLDDLWTFRGRTGGYFYVPKGTKILGGFATGGYRIYDPDGKVLLSDQSGYFNIPVPEGQDGKLWEFGYANGKVALLTVPSYFARSPQELLLPREVIEADFK